MFNVHLRVNDAATNRPTPVRLRIAGPDGRAYVPLGRVAEFPVGRNEEVGGHVVINRERYCYIDGSCEIPLPSGVLLTVRASKGPEYSPIHQTITLGPGQMAIRLTISRRTNLREEGWHSGDTRCHFLTPHAALLEAMAEDLAVVELLVAEAYVAGQDGVNYPSLANVTAFSGQTACLSSPSPPGFAGGEGWGEGGRAGSASDWTAESPSPQPSPPQRRGRGGRNADLHLVSVNTFNRHPVLGSLALLHCHRAVFPVNFGGADATDDWSLADWCDQCHRKKGLVVWADPFRFETGVAPEALADLVLGRIDAVECTPNSAKLRDWYRAWSAGIRFPLAGASGKDSNRTILGSMRTYAHLSTETPFSLANWIDAVRAGRTFVTSGPLVRLFVDEQPPGEILDRMPESAPIRIRATVDNLPSASAMEILVNGEVIGRAIPDEARTAKLELEHPVSGPCWLAARCLGMPQSDGFAHTSPVWVRVNGEWPHDPKLRREFATMIEGTTDWVNTHGRFEIPRRKEALLEVLESGRQLLLR